MRLYVFSTTGDLIQDMATSRDLTRQGRFAHVTEQDHKFFQRRVDESWEKWWLPGIVPFTPKVE